MRLFEHIKEKFDDGSEKSMFYVHPILSTLIIIGAVWGVITAIKVIFDAFA